MPTQPSLDGPRRAKIVATLGPASNTENVFRDLVRAGLDVARLNFSHGTHPEKVKLIQMIRKVSARKASQFAFLPTCRARRSAPAGCAIASRYRSRAASTS